MSVQQDIVVLARDARLRGCSLGARGVYLSILALLPECDIKGCLVISAKSLTKNDVRSLCAIDACETTLFDVAWEELLIWHLVARDGECRYYVPAASRAAVPA